MLIQSQRSAEPDEREQIDKRAGTLWFGQDALLGRRRRDATVPVIEVASVEVERCFVLRDFDEENPIYLLDFSRAALILFGQWLYDPHTLLCSEAAFDTWDCGRRFFSSFEVSYVSGSGDVLSLKVTAPGHVDVEPLVQDLRFKRLRECEIVPRTQAGLVADLRTAGLIL